ncbi:hypothetical protein [Dyella caseinilytica]|uniref:Flagellar protein FliO/FliZ n=1 Tax=Dyella caseinilytica TaxID=1849581 RepID=A0ABX7GNQ7_9GAMM|nr:hypothetical protein [Dyella caseinilytica]QRN52054.1 hypothetical protein ISN74_11100 [Dyella caseinilytica]GGA15816.1 hypothetical protein GCM10011408_42230 [Dyella caseinilytica]
MAPAIPYRTDAPVSAGTFATALLVTLCLITLLVFVLIFIRRRGWLSLPMVARNTPSQELIQLRGSRRLSMTTTAYVVSYGSHTYMIVESSRGAQAAITRIDPDQQGEGAP